MSPLSRIRLYNHKGRYHHFSTKNWFTLAYKRPLKTVKYLTKSVGKKKYMSGRLVLPTKFCDTHPGEQYRMIRLGRTHLVLKNRAMWGESFMIFYKSASNGPSTFLRFSSSRSNHKMKRKPSHFSKHTRRVGNKRYVSPKVYLPSSLIGQEVFVIKLDIPIQLEFPIEHKLSLIPGKTASEKEWGKAYVLFCENKVRNRTEVAASTLPKIESYKLTMQMIDQDFSIGEISRKRKIQPGTIWSHIARAFKKDTIKSVKLNNLIRRYCEPEIRDDLVIFMERLRGQQEAFDPKISKYSRKELSKKLDITNKELRNQFETEYHKMLPLHMVECVKLYLESLYLKG